jgi:hypothetical protein
MDFMGFKISLLNFNIAVMPSRLFYEVVEMPWPKAQISCQA